MSEYTAEQRAADNERWLSQRLGRTSVKVRDIVRTLVCEGDWILDEAHEGAIKMSRHGDDGVVQHLLVYIQYRNGASADSGRPSGPSSADAPTSNAPPIWTRTSSGKRSGHDPHPRAGRAAANPAKATRPHTSALPSDASPQPNANG